MQVDLQSAHLKICNLQFCSFMAPPSRRPHGHRAALWPSRLREARDASLSEYCPPATYLDVELKCDRPRLSQRPIVGRSNYLRDRIAATFPQDGVSRRGTRRTARNERLSVDPRSHRRHEIVHSRRAAILDVSRRGVREPERRGVIHVPALDETVLRRAGLGAWYCHAQEPPRRAHVSQRQPLSSGLFVTSEVLSFERTGRRAAYDRLQAAAPAHPHLGDGLRILDGGHGPGRRDGRSDHGHLGTPPRCRPSLEEAGGTFTDWKGNAAYQAGEGVATNGLLCWERCSALLRKRPCVILKPAKDFSPRRRFFASLRMPPIIPHAASAA